MLTQLYAFAGLMSFSTFCWVISLHVDEISNQINKFVENNKYPSRVVGRNAGNRNADKITIQLVNQWRDWHVIMIESVALIQDCFGILLFVWVMFAAINSMTNAFFLSNMVLDLNEDRSNLEWEYAFFLTRSIVNLFLLTISPVILKGKVYNSSKVPELSNQIPNYYSYRTSLMDFNDCVQWILFFNDR